MTESSQGAAELQGIKDAIIQLGAIIHAHEPRLSRLELAMQQLNTTVQGLCARPPPDPPTSEPPPPQTIFKTPLYTPTDVLKSVPHILHIQSSDIHDIQNNNKKFQTKAAAVTFCHRHGNSLKLRSLCHRHGDSLKLRSLCHCHGD